MRILAASVMALLLGSSLAMAQQNTCQWANDNECDEQRYGGTGACPTGSDANDCAMLALGRTDDSCQWANDGECDEPRFGSTTPVCVDGTDTSDCQGLATAGGLSQPISPPSSTGLVGLIERLPQSLRGSLGTDTCEYANDNECDDGRFGGTGLCPDATDMTDCARLAAQIADDSCRWANDNECDEPRYGSPTRACVDGSDTTDCGGILSAGATGTLPIPQTPMATVEDLMALLPQTVRATLGDDSCQWANDHECDDPNFGGTGACPAGTDASDCRALAIGGDDSCQYANDAECDEIGIGLGFCGSGTDTTDCAAVAFLRNRDDSCPTAFNGICDEADLGNGTCQRLTDTADCIGRGRPAEMQDHYFGRDDRYLPDTTQMPFRAIGLLEAVESACTGTLIGPNLVLTAAHCVSDGEGNAIEQLSFSAGFGPNGMVGSAGISRVIFAPDYSNEVAAPGEGNGNDWGLVILDSNLGDQVGYLRVHPLGPNELAQIASGGLLVDQSGYSHDTSPNQSANRGCRLTQAFDDNSVMHECDTASGDSGSPFMINLGGEWVIVALDSQFFDPESKNSVFDQGNLAVDSRAFFAALAEVEAELAGGADQ